MLSCRILINTMFLGYRPKRIRHLYTTEKAAPILERLYEIRREWNQILTEGLTAEESAQAEQLISKMAENAWKCMNERESD